MKHFPGGQMGELKRVSNFTTRLPAVPDVFDSGRNVGALRPVRRVGFRSLWRGPADGISRCTYYCCNAYSS